MPRTFASEYDGEDARRARVRSLMRLSPASRHRSFMEDYDRFHRGPDASRERARVLHRPLTTDAHVVRDTFRFLRDDDEDAALGAWESRVARRYYDKLRHTGVPLAPFLPWRHTTTALEVADAALTRGVAGGNGKARVALPRALRLWLARHIQCRALRPL